MSSRHDTDTPGPTPLHVEPVILEVEPTPLNVEPVLLTVEPPSLDWQ